MINKIKTLIKKHITKKVISDFIYVTLGVILLAFAYTMFIIPNDIVTGGVSGIGVLIKILFQGFNPSTTILILNLVLLVFGLVFVGKDFFIKTAYGSLAFPLFIELFTKLYNKLLPYLNLDMTLIILCASLIAGFGMGLAAKCGGSTGGVEVIQRIMFKYLHIPFSISLYLIDGSIILLGMFLAGNISNSLYAIVFTFLSGTIVDMVVFSGFNKRAVYIISNKKDDIKKQIQETFDRGMTSIKVLGEYSQTQKDMLICVLSSSEYYKLRAIIEVIDPEAFYFAVRASEVRGEGFSYEKSIKNRN